MVDILVLGATGFTGVLITRYLLVHPERSKFTFGIAGRSKEKLDALLASLSKTEKDIPVVVVDVLKPEEIEAAVIQARVVINTVGPFWRWGTNVVKSCVQHGVHYVDLTGETPWHHEMIAQFNDAAIETKAVIIPSSGFDSIPSDLAVFLANQTLKEAAAKTGAPSGISKSSTAFRVKGPISSGTIGTAFTFLEEMPRSLVRKAFRDYSLSPISGQPYPRPKLVYSVFDPDRARKIWGGFWMMSNVNRSMVQRTWGLLQEPVNASRQKGETPDKLASQYSYGPELIYDEFLQLSGPISSFTFSLIFLSFVGSVILLPPFRWLAKRFIGDGIGPKDDATLEQGITNFTNITTSVTTPDHPEPTIVKTTCKGKGDPGYSLTAVMISESALCLLPESFPKLMPLAQRGGLLTPMSALGNTLIERLKKSGRFELKSFVVEKPSNKKID
ncbi:Saccharopine dehydrogenase-domain-containing protein [Flagelloscypha sp. PMI_526]|nr:Saccharopine dehydrogenase-domain-containing protein [Flagelloscypha sp. PMI_526]